MEEIELDTRDRGNLFSPAATNVLAYEASVAEVRDEMDMDDLYSRLDEAQGMVHSGKEDVAYVVIKISK